MGQDSSKYLSELRNAQPDVENIYGKITAMRIEMVRVSDREETAKQDLIAYCTRARESLGVILNNQDYDLDPMERSNIRSIRDELIELNSAVDAYDPNDKENTQDKAMISKMSVFNENLNQFLTWLDEKLARKWWVTSTLRASRLLLSIGMFVSSAGAVMIQGLIGPIITLSFTVASGVIDILDGMATRKKAQDRSALEGTTRRKNVAGM